MLQVVAGQGSLLATLQVAMPRLLEAVSPVWRGSSGSGSRRFRRGAAAAGGWGIRLDGRLLVAHGFGKPGVRAHVRPQSAHMCRPITNRTVPRPASVGTRFRSQYGVHPPQSRRTSALAHAARSATTCSASQAKEVERARWKATLHAVFHPRDVEVGGEHLVVADVAGHLPARGGGSMTAR